MTSKNLGKRISEIIKKADVSDYRAIPFWSWNDRLEKTELINQVRWMKENGFGGYFMHARSGLKTEYLEDEWFDCIEACVDEGEKLSLKSWAYDENGWPSGFVGGKLLENPKNCDKYLTNTIGEYKSDAQVSYLITENELIRVYKGGEGEYLNIYIHTAISTADILNPKVVDQFIELTHNEYKRRLKEKFGRKLRGFFTDEPQYHRAHQPYTDMIAKYFKDKYGEDILDNLGLIFLEKKGYKEFRYRFWKGMQELLLENFSKKVYKWCEENGCSLTGHYIEETSLNSQILCCGGVMPFYEYMTIPGIDHLGKGSAGYISPKQVSSVAAQMGKKRVLTETFAGAGWDFSPKKAKLCAEGQYVKGINLMCQHLLPYSIVGQRKRDYPVHFSWANPWCRKDFKRFNDYFANLGYLLGESEEKVNVGVFSPIRSVYFNYKRESYLNKCPINISYTKLCEKLSKMNVPYHILDETIMAKHGRIEGKKLIVGKCAYDFIVFPKTVTIDKTTEKLFTEFISKGGKVLFTDEKPTYLEGEEHSYCYQTNTTFDEIVATQQYSINNFNTTVESTLREIDGKKFIYAVNLCEDKEEEVEFIGDFNSFICLDLENYSTKRVGKKVNFKPGESFVLFLDDECLLEDNKTVKELVLTGEFKVKEVSDNYLTLDTLSYSYDNIKYSKPMRDMGVFDDLLKERYKGNLYLKYTFNVKNLPKKIELLAEDMNTEWCEVNGKRVLFDGCSEFEKKILKTDIKDHIVKGENQVIIKINYFQRDEVYFVLYGKNVTEGLKNKLYYDTNIEACYLQGDFGVYSEQGIIQDENQSAFMRGNDFYIDKQQKIVTTTVNDGFPFFAGTMTLEKEFYWEDDCDCVLDLQGNFCAIDLILNGKTVEKSYFATKVDVTKYLVNGKNILTAVLISGNRNLLGPHHYKFEPIGVSPNTFDMFGFWKNGECDKNTKDYSFVKFGLFEK